MLYIYTYVIYIYIYIIYMYIYILHIYQDMRHISNINIPQLCNFSVHSIERFTLESVDSIMRICIYLYRSRSRSRSK